MMKTLPFTALRTFEAVARLRGFGRAAEELNVTQSAVSQHVKLLEEWLNQKLVLRKSRGTEPTDAGARLAEAVRTGFGMVETLCNELRVPAQERGRSLQIGAPPGFAFLWLLPRLLDFDARHPDISVSLTTDPHARDLRVSDADALICYSSGGFPDLHAERILTETLTPVCTPELGASLASPADLAHHMILEDIHDTPGHRSNWEIWSNEAGVPLPPFPRKRRFGQANLVIQAAADGLGIAMGRSSLVEGLMNDGRLVQPFDKAVPSQFSYWFVCRYEAMKQPSVEAFRSWVRNAANT